VEAKHAKQNMMMVLTGLNTRRMGNTRGRAVLASALAAVLILSVSFRLVRAASGDLDSSFGTGGKLTLAFPGANDVARAAAIQSDGKIIAAGTDGNDFMLVRYNSNGTVDTTFGSSGRVSPANITVTAGPGKREAIVNFAPTAADNCSPVTITCNPPSGSSFPIGTTSVSCSATDSYHNLASCSFTVTVKKK